MAEEGWRVLQWIPGEDKGRWSTVNSEGYSGDICEEVLSRELRCERGFRRHVIQGKWSEAPSESRNQEGIDHLNGEPGKEKINGIYNHFTEILRKSWKFQARKLNEN